AQRRDADLHQRRRDRHRDPDEFDLAEPRLDGRKVHAAEREIEQARGYRHLQDEKEELAHAVGVEGERETRAGAWNPACVLPDLVWFCAKAGKYIMPLE